MRDYNRNNRSGGGGRYGRGGDFRRRDSGPREMHSAVCDECGKNCEVPFRPSGDKPIYCSDCFERKDDGGSRRPTRGGSGGGGRSSFGERDNTSKQLLEQVSLMNSKLDQILKVFESIAKKHQVSKIHEDKKVVKRATSKDKVSKTKKASKKVAKEVSKSTPKE